MAAHFTGEASASRFLSVYVLCRIVGRKGGTGVASVDHFRRRFAPWPACWLATSKPSNRWHGRIKMRPSVAAHFTGEASATQRIRPSTSCAVLPDARVALALPVFDPVAWLCAAYCSVNMAARSHEETLAEPVPPSPKYRFISRQWQSQCHPAQSIDPYHDNGRANVWLDCMNGCSPGGTGFASV